MMQIAVIGGGIAGLSAAYDLLGAGHAVVVYESSDATGGLARGFRDPAWEWPLEHFYHHLFTSDRSIIELVGELGISERLFFPAPRTSIFHDGRSHPFSNPLDWWRFPGMNPVDYVRFGAVGAFLRYTRFWRYLERFSADSWTRRAYGRKLHELVWQPLLIGKFGPYYREANMAWLWARLHVRSFKLGYFEGGFQAFVDRLTEAVAARGGQIACNTPVRQIGRTADGRLRVETAHGAADFDRVLHTTSPALLARLAPELPADYLDALRRLKSMGAVVLVLALRRQLLTDGTYWLNLPARSVDKTRNAVPFLALVEHTNYIDPVHYGGDRIVYCGDYVPPEHPYLSMNEEELAQVFLPALVQFNPEFEQGWVRKRWLFRAPYAQPVPERHHSRHVPDLATPWPQLYLAGMSQVYPWDRGTNFAVEIGRRAARRILDSAR